MRAFSIFVEGLVDVASRVSARRPRYFSLLRQRKVPKRKATRVRLSLRCAKGNLRCSQQAGSLQTRLSPQTCNLLFPPVAPLLGTRTREGEEASPRFASVGGVSSSPIPSLRWCKAPAAAPAPSAPHLPCRRAEERSGGRMKQAACLSEASLQTARPMRAPQGARSAAEGHAYQGRLSLAYVSLAKQRKVRRPPGRDPACHFSQHLTDKKQHA
jgi:hypothetical protein